MLRHSPHHTHARCGETSNFSTSVMWRNLKLLNMWRNVRFLHISTMWRNLKLLHMWRNFRFLHICHAYKFEISPHDKFFSTYLICDVCDKYQVWEWLISAMDLLQPIETSKRIIWEENGRHLILKLPVVDFNMRELFFPTNFLWAKLHELFSEMQHLIQTF